MKPHVLRLRPGQDLKQMLLAYCQSQGLNAGFVTSAIGSLKTLNIRLANSNTTLKKTEFFEVLSLQGSLTQNAIHLHLSVADSKGHCWGGHLLEGCEIYTTAEIFITELTNFIFTREWDEATGFQELVIKKKL